MKAIVNILVFASCTLILLSCSIVRGLRTDGKNGPSIFSFEGREHDTIAIGDVAFHFPVAQKQADWIDTTYFYNKPHRCDSMTFGEAFTKESSTQGIIIIHNDSVVYERYWGDFISEYCQVLIHIG